MKRQEIVLDNTTYEVVATVHDDDTNKDFVIYTDKKIDQRKGIKLSCVLYHEENGKIIPEKITDEKDQETAKEIIQEAADELKKMFKR